MSPHPPRAGTGFYLASFDCKTKQIEKKKSHSSAPKKLLAPLPPSTHRIPRNRMHVPIPARQSAGAQHEEMKSSEEQRESCSAPELTQSSWRSKWHSRVPHTLAVPTAQSQKFCFITQISIRSWVKPPFFEVRWPQLTPTVHSPPTSQSQLYLIYSQMYLIAKLKINLEQSKT